MIYNGPESFLMIEIGYDFKQAVSILENWRHQFKMNLTK